MKRRALLDYKRTAPVGIGAAHDPKAERKAEESAVIKAVRWLVFQSRHACQLCGGRRAAECEGRPDEMHEDPPRSATRGWPAVERFNVRVCGRLCWACHRDVTEKRIRVCFADAVARFSGRVTAKRWEEPCQP